MVYAYVIGDEHKRINTKRLDSYKRCPVGTSLRNDEGEFRYACAGEDIGKHVLVEPGLAEEDEITLAFSRRMELFADIVFGKVIAARGNPKNRPGILGWPEVDVKKGQYFWIHEIPPGSTLMSEASAADVNSQPCPETPV